MAKKPPSSTDAGILAVLRGTALLADVGDRTLAKIAQATRRRSYEEGDTVYEMGDPVENLYFVAAGKLRFALGGGSRIEGGGSVILPGDILGWAALVADLPRRIATVVSLDQSELLEIGGTAFLDILAGDPRAGFLVMQRLARMIAQTFLEQSRRLSVS